MTLLDVSNPLAPEFILTYPWSPQNKVAVLDDIVYFLEPDGLWMIHVTELLAVVTDPGRGLDRDHFLGLTPGTPAAIYVNNGFAYCAMEEGSISIVDVEPFYEGLTLVGEYSAPNVIDLVAREDYFYVAVAEEGLWAFDVSDPSTPFNLGGIEFGGEMENLAINGNQLIMTADWSGFFMVENLSETPVMLSGFSALRRGDEALISWEIGLAEPGVGFNLYREDENNARARLNEAPLSGGSSFEFTDVNAPRTETIYHLEALENGEAYWLGRTFLASAPEATAAVLSRNFPNPFNPRTRIEFSLPERGFLRLAIYDVSGRLLATPVDGVLNAGDHAVDWDGRDAMGNQLPSGIYLARLSSRGSSQEIKLVLTR